jgi:hypothetical protein
VQLGIVLSVPILPLVDGKVQEMNGIGLFKGEKMQIIQGNQLVISWELPDPTILVFDFDPFKTFVSFIHKKKEFEKATMGRGLGFVILPEEQGKHFMNLAIYDTSFFPLGSISYHAKFTLEDGEILIDETKDIEVIEGEIEEKSPMVPWDLSISRSDKE